MREEIQEAINKARDSFDRFNDILTEKLMR